MYMNCFLGLQEYPNFSSKSISYFFGVSTGNSSNPRGKLYFWGGDCRSVFLKSMNMTHL